MNVDVAYAGEDTLGESPFWSTVTQSLSWIDGFEPAVHTWHPATSVHSSVTLPSAPVGMIVETSNPRIVAMSHGDGVCLFNLDDRSTAALANPEQARQGIGYNDAKVDRAGRLWVGTYDETETEQRGCLWLLEHGQPPRLADTGMAVVNGPAFSPDGAIMYVSDSIARRILAFDVVAGTVRGRRVLVALEPEEGMPDGLTVDSQGCLWCAHWDGGRVTRF